MSYTQRPNVTRGAASCRTEETDRETGPKAHDDSFHFFFLDGQKYLLTTRVVAGRRHRQHLLATSRMAPRLSFTVNLRRLISACSVLCALAR